MVFQGLQGPFRCFLKGLARLARRHFCSKLWLRFPPLLPGEAEHKGWLSALLQALCHGPQVSVLCGNSGGRIWNKTRWNPGFLALKSPLRKEIFLIILLWLVFMKKDIF